MEATPRDEPTVDELVEKALQAKVIDEDLAEDLRHSADLEDALGMFYTHIISEDGQPDDLLIEWGIIEPTTTPQAEEASNRLLDIGTKVKYSELLAKLQEDEVLVATWLRDPANLPKVQCVTDENDYRSIVGKTVHGYYVQLRWFASKTGSENPVDYDMFD